MMKRVFAVLSLRIFVGLASASALLGVAETAKPTQGARLGLELIPILISKPSALRGNESGDPDVLYSELPVEVGAFLGERAQIYESFVVARLVPEELARLRSLLDDLEWNYSLDLPDEIQLPFSHFDPRKGRETALGQGFDRPVPGLFLLQFGYPLRAEWLETLRACGAQVVAPLQHRALLVQAKSLSALIGCVGLQDVIAWTGPFRNGDRIDPALLETPTEEVTLSLQYLPGSDCAQKVARLPEGIVALDDEGRPTGRPCAGTGSDFLRVSAKGEAVKRLVAEDPNLLSVLPASEAAWSDERQGQIISGHHDGVAVIGPGYKAWLQGRGLLSTVNSQVVATHDSGYDDGTFSGGTDGLGDHHPDLELPERLLATATFPSTATHEGDSFGHGTMVAGIIAGDVTNTSAAGAKDYGQYLYGLGIAPTAKIAAARFGTSLGLQSRGIQGDAHRWSSARSAIINQSWNAFVNRPGPLGTLVSFPVAEYNEMAQALDQWTLDADSIAGGAQRVLEVVSAANYAAASGSPQFDTVSSPGTAKNVLTVGATESYRPIASGPASTSRCPDDSANVSRVAGFSGRGKEFRPDPFPATSKNTRIKPDVVAPGVRVISTVPYQYSPYTGTTAVGCTPFFPNGSFYAYGSGTSFAAPVVSGVAALKRQQLLNAGIVDPAPALLKAAIIATADDLGGTAGNDHRPSPLFGWGRVNLDRLTDSRATLVRNDNAGTAVATGQARIYTGTIDSGTAETRIALAWTDLPAAIATSSQAPLLNDLELQVAAGSSSIQYFGNIFNETVGLADDGFSYRFTFGPHSSDTKNTVEVVILPANSLATGSPVTIKVVGANVTNGPQRFSLYAYNVR